MSTPVKKAVIPIAGLGTRFLPATKAVPKALLTIMNKPIIQYAVEEVARAGITEVALISSPHMQAVAGYFAPDTDLTDALQAQGKHELAASIDDLTSLVHITDIVQTKPLGLGHAIWQAQDWADGQPFVVVLPDDLAWDAVSPTQQLLDAYAQHGGQFIAGLEIPDADIPFKGIIDYGDELDTTLSVYSVRSIVEKPPLASAPSNLSIYGRYILSPEIFDAFSTLKPGAIGELQITDAIAAATSERLPLRTVQLTGSYSDAGNPLGMLSSIMHYIDTSADDSLRQLVLSFARRWQ